MQTRRDQLQAYRFQNRRALAALVTGDANVVEPPMRRLTAMTVSGIMIAILVTVVFALLGKFSPDTGDSWKDAGAVIIDNDTGAIYLYQGSNNTLHPVLNYTSALLAIKGNAAPHTVHVDADDIKSAERGYLVGIRGLPFTLPSSSSLTKGPWSVCSALQVDATTGATSVRTAVSAGPTGSVRALGADTPVLVQAAGGRGPTYVLINHQRLEISRQVAAALQLSAAPVPVSTAFLDGVPAGSPLRVPSVPGLGSSTDLVPGAQVGQLVRETGSGATAVVLRDGFLVLANKVQVALLQTLPVNTRTLSVPDNVVTSNVSTTDGTQLQAAFGQLPAQIEPAATDVQRAKRVCAIYRSPTPTFAVEGSINTTATAATVSQTATSTAGLADDVSVPSNSAALVRSDDKSTTAFIVDPSGQKFALGAGAQQQLGYGSATPVTLAQQLLALIPKGPAMDRDAAAQPPSK